MINTISDYQKAQDELLQLEKRLVGLQQTAPQAKGFTKAGIRKMIARLHEELAVYEGSQEAARGDPA
ncbi:MAG: hypothetical protein ABIP88_14055 [Candidatus Binatia bacterium]